MNLGEFIYGVLVLVATFITVVGIAGLYFDSQGKDKKIEDLERQLASLRKKNMEKVRKEREANSKPSKSKGR